MGFTLHEALAEDCAHVGDLSACRILLMDNQRFPWLIMVPMREGLREITDLTDADYHLVTQEIRYVARHFAEFTGAHKMNIAALGNMVPQLHIHVIARYRHDPAWPNPVWNSGVLGEPYTESGLSALLRDCRHALGLGGFPVA